MIAVGQHELAEHVREELIGFGFICKDYEAELIAWIMLKWLIEKGAATGELRSVDL